MPRSKRMARKETLPTEEDEASEALLDSITDVSWEREEREKEKDNPFLDDEGDLKVVPTLEDLSSLVGDSPNSVLPMKEILRRNLKVTLRAIEMAEIAYHANPRQGTAIALTQMQNLAKDLIKAIEDRMDPTALRDDVMEQVIKHMVFEFIKVLTSEADIKRSALMAVCPPESAGVVRHEMADLLKGVSSGCDEAFAECKRKLDDLLGARFKGAKK